MNQLWQTLRLYFVNTKQHRCQPVLLEDIKASLTILLRTRQYTVNSHSQVLCIPIYLLMYTIYNYRPPTKLRQGNVFTCVCLSTGMGLGMSGSRSLLGVGDGWVCLVTYQFWGWVCLVPFLFQGWYLWYQVPFGGYNGTGIPEGGGYTRGVG